MKQANGELKIVKAAGGRIKDVKAVLPNGSCVGWLRYRLNVFERNSKSCMSVSQENPFPLRWLTIKTGGETSTQVFFQTMVTFPLRGLL
jgi:hypothetical protein